MSANISQRRLQSIVLASSVADFATWRLVVTCRGCCNCRTRLSACGKCPASAMATSHLPPDATFATVLHRLRCAKCGSRADRVLLDNQAPDWQRRVIRIWGVERTLRRPAPPRQAAQRGAGPCYADRGGSDD